MTPNSSYHYPHGPNIPVIQKYHNNMVYFWLTVTTNHGDVIYVYFQVRDKTQ